MPTSAPAGGVAPDIITRAASPRERAARGRLPRWATDLENLLAGSLPGVPQVPPFRLGELFDDDLLAPVGAAPNDEWSVHRLFEPLLRVAAARLDTTLATSRMAVAPGARRAMLAQLAARWSSLASQVLYHRIDILDLLEELPGELGSTVYDVHCADGRPAVEQWESVLQVYPVLGRLFAVAFRNWARAIGHLVRRLSSDAAQLEREFAGGGELGALVGYSADAGDAHDGGQTVSLLTFEQGCRLVYKPKDLRIAAWYMQLVGRLNGDGLTPPLPWRRILARGDYAWEEFAVVRSCTTRDEVRRFYRRMGMHARLIQLLDGTDFTTDNVLPCGENPVLIDLEMLLVPHRTLPASLTPNERAAEERAWDSPCRSGLVSAKIAGEPGVRPADVGALAPAASRVAPFKQTALCRADDGSVRLCLAYPRFGGNSATPSLHGKPVNPEEFYGDVVDGYVRMTACLRRASPRLFGAAGMLDAVAEMPVRLLWRDTHIYARLLEESLRPHRLRDGASREMCLERLWKAGVESPAVVQSEIDSLRDLDIPLFGGRPADDVVRGAAGVTEHGRLEGTSLDRVRRRAHALTRATGASAAEEIRTALFQLTPAWRRKSLDATRATGVDWLGEATRAGEFVLDQAITSRGNTPAWVGLGYDSCTDAWAFGALKPDWLSGTAGLAVVLAELGAASGSSRFADAARAILYSLSDRLGGYVPGDIAQIDRRRTLKRAGCGAFVGWGGWVYACLRGGAALGEAALVRRCRQSIDGFSREAIGDGATPPSEAAGLVSVLGADVRMPGALPRAVALEMLESWRAAGAFGGAACPDDATMLQRLPPPDAGACLALLRMARRSGDDRFAEPWRAWRRVAAFRHETASAGDILALLGALGDGDGDVDNAVRAARAYLARMRGASEASVRLDAAEVAITAYELTAEPSFFDLATDFATDLVGSRRASGHWFADLLAPDRYHLSALFGVGAIAHLFARLAGPGPGRSLRLLAPIAVHVAD